MTREEEKKLIKEFNENEYYLISPHYVGAGTLVHDGNYTQAVNLYDAMEDNTLDFVRDKIINLEVKSMSDSSYKDCLSFNMVFCGSREELCSSNKDLIDLILDKKDKIIAIYSILDSVDSRDVFFTFSQKEHIYHYHHIFIKLSKLLEEFDKKDIEYYIDPINCPYGPEIYGRDITTRLIIKKRLTKDKEEESKQFKKI